MNRKATLRQRLLQNQTLAGLFTRLSDPEAVEALAASRLDFVVLDHEHSSLGRADISRIIAAAQARDLPVLVRVPGMSEPDIHHALAVGAAGVIVPHIASADDAARAAGFARGPALERAYAGMGRAADYRRAGWQAFRQQAHEQQLVIAQIDEAQGARAAADIARVPGVDAVFVGSLSLALALGAADPQAPEVDQAIQAICRACAEAGRRVGVHAMDAASREAWSARGVKLFVIGNDLNLLRQGADEALRRFLGPPPLEKLPDPQ